MLHGPLKSWSSLPLLGLGACGLEAAFRHPGANLACPSGFLDFVNFLDFVEVLAF